MTEKSRRLWLGLLLALLVILLRPPGVQTSYDSAVYTLVGSEMLHGRALYVDLQDQKGPLVYLFFAALYRLFGFSSVLLGAVGSLWILGVVLLAAALGARLLGRGVFWYVALAGAYVTLFPLGQELNGEHLLAALVVGGVLLVVRARQGGGLAWALLGGVLGGLSLFTRPTAVADLAAIALALLLSSRGEERARGLRVFGVTLVGVLAAVGAVLGWMAATGILRGFWECVFAFNLRYVAGGPFSGGSVVNAAAHAIAEILMTTAPYWLLAATGLALLWPRRGEEPPPGGRLVVPLLGLWVLFTAALTPLGGNFFPHYFFALVPATAILAGAALQRLRAPEVGERRLARGFAWGLLALTLLSLAPRLGPARDKWSTLAAGTPPSRWEDRLGQALAAQGAQRGEWAFAWPFLPQVYLWSGTRPASRIVNAWTRPWPPEAGEEGQVHQQRGDYEAWEADLAARPPAWVVLVRTEGNPQETAAYRYLRDWAAAHGYRQVGEAENAEIWRCGG